MKGYFIYAYILLFLLQISCISKQHDDLLLDTVNHTLNIAQSQYVTLADKALEYDDLLPKTYENDTVVMVNSALVALCLVHCGFFMKRGRMI